uniref:ORF4 n=1 Tax=Grapevine Kizil Sapak virus TaxID=2650001 RepID=A0A6M2VJB5_9VIRU|nr:ORF4 [Grapevine Kizil Sapak virus]
MTQGLYIQLYSLINSGFSLSSLYSSIYKVLQFPLWASKYVPFVRVKEKRTVGDGSMLRYKKAGYGTLSEATTAFCRDFGSGNVLVCWDWSPGFKPGLPDGWPNISGVCGATKIGRMKPSVKVWAADSATLETILMQEVTQDATKEVEVLRSVDGLLKDFENEVGQGGASNTLQISASSFSRDNNEAIWMASVER